MTKQPSVKPAPKRPPRPRLAPASDAKAVLALALNQRGSDQ